MGELTATKVKLRLPVGRIAIDLFGDQPIVPRLRVDQTAEALDQSHAERDAEAEQREAGRGMADVYQIAEGRQASARLISAWGRMQARYPGWSPETSNSIYHHLCALDLF